MKLLWTERGWSDYPFWQSVDLKMLARINELLKDVQRGPFQGIEMSGWWSRRITQEHRLIYRVSGSGDAQAIEIAACRFHYGR
ncbi:MAG: Txe/YoeB family addiction module toxin [Mesorhizobium sp.]